MNGDDELPAWIEILERGPLKVYRLSPKKPKTEFEARIGTHRICMEPITRWKVGAMQQSNLP